MFYCICQFSWLSDSHISAKSVFYYFRKRFLNEIILWIHIRSEHSSISQVLVDIITLFASSLNRARTGWKDKGSPDSRTLASESGSHSLFLVLGTPCTPSRTYTGTSLFPTIAGAQAFFTMIIYDNLFDIFAPLPQLLQIHPFPYRTNFVSKSKQKNSYKNPHHPWWRMRCILICG